MTLQLIATWHGTRRYYVPNELHEAPPAPSAEDVNVIKLPDMMVCACIGVYMRAYACGVCVCVCVCGRYATCPSNRGEAAVPL